MVFQKKGFGGFSKQKPQKMVLVTQNQKTVFEHQYSLMALEHFSMESHNKFIKKSPFFKTDFSQRTNSVEKKLLRNVLEPIFACWASILRVGIGFYDYLCEIVSPRRP